MPSLTTYQDEQTFGIINYIKDKGMDFLKSSFIMRKIESLQSAKFEKLGSYVVADASKIYGGKCQITQIRQGNGMNWDFASVTGTNFYSDGGTVGSAVTTNYIPSYITEWAASHC